MQIRKGFTEKINKGKGMKQGCPLSPTLCNLEIDLLIRKIRENYQEYGYKCEDNSPKTKVIQTYADGMLIFPEKRTIVIHQRSTY
jgi:retron-type reverse transcriptase